MLSCRAAVCVFLLGGAALAVEPSVPGGVREEARLTACGGAGPGTLDIVWGDLLDEPALENAVCDWFRDEKWRVRFASPSTSPRASQPSLRVLVTLPSTQRARLSVDVASGQHWIREVELDAGLGEAGVEVIAEALHSVAQALDPEAAELLPRDVAPPKPALPPAPPKPALPPAPPKPAPRDAVTASTDGADVASAGRGRSAPRVATGRHLPVRSGVGYLAYLRGDEPILHGPVLHLALDWLLRELTFGSFFRAALLTSDAKRVLGLQVESTGVSLGSGMELRAPLSALGLRAAFGGSMDLIALDVQVLDPATARLAQDLRARPRFFLGAEAGVDWQMGAFELELSALLRWQLSHTTYQVRDGDEIRTVLEPWRLQPGASITAAYIW